jgi:hypothetical protein
MKLAASAPYRRERSEGMPLLASALLRTWDAPEVALASARVGLLEARASECPYRTDEYERSVRYLEWVAGPLLRDWRTPSLRQLLRRLSVPDFE